MGSKFMYAASVLRGDLATMKKLDLVMCRSTCLLVCCLLLIGQVQESRQLAINSINVPELVREGELDYVILDCDYDLGNSSSVGLVVKWWQNKELIYMWHVGREPAADSSSTHIDVGYKVSDDPIKMYRAMKFIDPNITLSGIYKCNVFNYQDEANEEAPMIVYSSEEKFELVYKKTNEDEVAGVDVKCLAEGLFPQPIMDISINDVSTNDTTKPEITIRDDGKYDIVTRIALNDEDLYPSVNIKCTLEIPLADYRIPRELVYYPGSATTTPSATTKLLRTMEIQAYDSNQQNTDNGGGSAGGIVSTSLISVIVSFFTLRTLSG